MGLKSSRRAGVAAVLLGALCLGGVAAAYWHDGDETLCGATPTLIPRTPNSRWVFMLNSGTGPFCYAVAPSFDGGVPYYPDAGGPFVAIGVDGGYCVAGTLVGPGQPTTHPYRDTKEQAWCISVPAQIAGFGAKVTDGP